MLQRGNTIVPALGFLLARFRIGRRWFLDAGASQVGSHAGAWEPETVLYPRPRFIYQRPC